MKNMIGQMALMVAISCPLFAVAECAPTTKTECHVENQTVVSYSYDGFASCSTSDGQHLSQYVTSSNSPTVTLFGSNGRSCTSGLHQLNERRIETVVQKNVCQDVQVPPVYTAGCDIAKACTHYGTTSINNVSTFAVNAVSHCGACGTKTSIQTGGSGGAIVHFSCAQ